MEGPARLVVELFLVNWSWLNKPTKEPVGVGHVKVSWRMAQSFLETTLTL